jgi:hypothetical protein
MDSALNTIGEVQFLLTREIGGILRILTEKESEKNGKQENIRQEFQRRGS